MVRAGISVNFKRGDILGLLLAIAGKKSTTRGMHVLNQDHVVVQSTTPTDRSLLLRLHSIPEDNLAEDLSANDHIRYLQVS